MEPQEYIVKNSNAVGVFIDGNIGVDYQINDIDDITVFDLEPIEHLLIRDFIDANDLWKDLTIKDE